MMRGAISRQRPGVSTPAKDSRPEEEAQFTVIKHLTNGALAHRLEMLVEDPHTFRRPFRDAMLVEAARRLTAKEAR